MPDEKIQTNEEPKKNIFKFKVFINSGKCFVINEGQFHNEPGTSEQYDFVIKDNTNKIWKFYKPNITNVTAEPIGAV